MNSEQIRAYRQATADRAAAEQGRTVHDQEMISSHDRAVRSGLRVLRDIDHEQALLDDHAEAIAEDQALDDLDDAVVDHLAQTGAWTPVKDYS